jgi:NAD(P) transhydrogenase subunit alpha
LPEDIETQSGYAKEQSEAFLREEREVIGARLPKVNVVVCTAQVFGKRAPILMTGEMVKLLQPGSVIVDLAAEQGGNCELTVPGQTVEKHGVTVIGLLKLASMVPVDASHMYSRNIATLFLYLTKEGKLAFDRNDEIVKSCLVTLEGKVVNDTVIKAMEKGGR